MSGVRSEEEIYMMHQAAYRYCRPEASIKFDTYHVEGRTIVVATVPPSDKRKIDIGDPIRETGIREISVWLYTGITTKMKLDVQPIKK